MLTHINHQQGVSLVEIMIALTIFAMLLALGVPSYSTYIQNTQIRNAAEALQNGLSAARAEAVRRNTLINFTSAEHGAWTIECTPDANAPVSPDPTPDDSCPSPLASRPASDGSIKASIALSEQIASTNVPVVSATFSDTSPVLTFNGLGQARSLTAGHNAVFDITNPAGGDCVAANGAGKMRCLRVTVSSGGQVRMCDPVLTTTKPTDPQAC